MSDASTIVAHPFVEACFDRPHERVPIWMMRQAGRYLPEYRKVREQYTFLEMCHTPEVAAEVTLQPLRRFDLDAAIIFSDILIFLPDMGLRIDFPGGGPQIENPLSSPADVDALVEFDPAAGEHAVYEAIRICTAGLAGTKPLIGFAGAPYTLACYAIEGKGSKDWSQAKAFLHRHPKAADALLSKLAESAARHLQAQIDAGASVVQIFDSWAGSLGREDFETFSKPYITRIVDAVKRPDIPVIVFARGVPPDWQTGMGADVYGVDWRTDIRFAHDALAPAGVQGNLDPALLLGPVELAVERTARILDRMRGLDRFIFNLGHGVLPQTPPETVGTIVDTVHNISADGAT